MKHISVLWRQPWHFGACGRAVAGHPLFLSRKNESFIEWAPAASSHFITADSLWLLHDKGVAAPCQLYACYRWPLCCLTSFTEAACQAEPGKMAAFCRSSMNKVGKSISVTMLRCWQWHILPSFYKTKGRDLLIQCFLYMLRSVSAPHSDSVAGTEVMCHF